MGLKYADQRSNPVYSVSSCSSGEADAHRRIAVTIRLKFGEAGLIGAQKPECSLNSGQAFIRRRTAKAVSKNETAFVISYRITLPIPHTKSTGLPHLHGCDPQNLNASRIRPYRLDPSAGY